jgi:hypothetical protein
MVSAQELFDHPAYVVGYISTFHYMNLIGENFLLIT